MCRGSFGSSRHRERAGLIWREGWIPGCFRIEKSQNGNARSISLLLLKNKAKQNKTLSFDKTKRQLYFTK